MSSFIFSVDPTRIPKVALLVFPAHCGHLNSYQSKDCECIMEFPLSHFNVFKKRFSAYGRWLKFYVLKFYDFRENNISVWWNDPFTKFCHGQFGGRPYFPKLIQTAKLLLITQVTIKGFPARGQQFTSHATDTTVTSCCTHKVQSRIMSGDSFMHKTKHEVP